MLAVFPVPTSASSGTAIAKTIIFFSTGLPFDDEKAGAD
jgi:hypothetical protein